MATAITPERIADVIEEALGWALVGLTGEEARSRADARRHVAERVYSALYQPLNIETAQLTFIIKIDAVFSREGDIRSNNDSIAGYPGGTSLDYILVTRK